jgi:hypothetical protein
MFCIFSYLAFLVLPRGGHQVFSPLYVPLINLIFMKHGSKDDVYGAVVGAHRYFLYSNCYAAIVHEIIHNQSVVPNKNSKFT